MVTIICNDGGKIIMEMRFDDTLNFLEKQLGVRVSEWSNIESLGCYVKVEETQYSMSVKINEPTRDC